MIFNKILLRFLAMLLPCKTTRHCTKVFLFSHFFKSPFSSLLSSPWFWHPWLEKLSNWVFRALYKCDPIKLLAEYVEFNEIKGIFIHGAPHRCSECQRTKIDILFSKMPKNAKIVNFLYVSGNTVTFCKQKMVKIPSSYLGRKKSVWWWFPGAPWMNLWVIFLNSV